MARSAYFACMDCKVKLWVGVAIPRDTVEYFSHFGDEKRNWQDLELNRVVWKMLADHAGHHLRVILEWTPEYDAFVEEENVVEIGGDDPEYDISFEAYLKDWEG
jgi:hypothetical protein